MDGKCQMTEIASPDYFRYWGKASPDQADSSAYHLLPFHCLDVAACGQALLRLPQFSLASLASDLGWPQQGVEKLFLFFLALHDLGKFARAFQNLVPNLSPDLVPADERSFYVVSARPPQSDSGLFQIQSKPYVPKLESGDRLRFDLRANPTVSIRHEDGRSRRHDVLMNAKRSTASDARERLNEAVQAAGQKWLLERAEQWGLAIQEDSVLQAGYRQNRLRRKGGNIEYSSLDYQGMAQVIDPQRLARALLEGVGHSKGFGCGLLLVKRV